MMRMTRTGEIVDTQDGEPRGLKFDGGKPRFSLLRFGCAKALEGVARVLTFGAKKYAAHSWREVEEGVDRYWSAMERHMNEIAKHGLDSRDPESGELHIDHVNCNGVFLAELIRKQHGIES
ncbi:dATP/dGTP diphosphohydrolase domain-containing protein [Burkholderia ubonensis]|nr:dATP/dGTP diphosphohydrolase domain-containing protein [Burkholderia ubonensis]